MSQARCHGDASCLKAKEADKLLGDRPRVEAIMKGFSEVAKTDLKNKLARGLISIETGNCTYCGRPIR